MELAPTLQTELGATPLFRANTYRMTDGDPICGWLSGFARFMRETLEDLARLSAVEVSDLVYVSTALPAQLLAARLWFASLPEARRPSLIIEVNQTGLIGQLDGSEIRFGVPSDPRLLPWAFLFRFIGTRYLHPIPARLHIVTFDPKTSASLGPLLNCPVRTVPLPYTAYGAPRNRAGASKIVLGALGYQTVRKGYALLPELARRLLPRHPALELLIQTVHNGSQEMAAATAELAQITAVEPRLKLDARPAGAEAWPRLLEQIDLLLCPYSWGSYADSFSSMASEAAANGIPMVAPAHSTVEALLKAGGGSGVTFLEQDAPSIAAAVSAALDQFDVYADRAYRAALAWPETRGPDRLVDRVIALAGP